MTDSPNLTPAEINQLRRAVRKNPRVLNKMRETVSNEEYLKRRERDRSRDMEILTKHNEKQIEKALKDWRTQVGATFANAHTDIPAILDRVKRLASKTGLHKTSLILYGRQSGSGKTWNAYSYLNHAIADGAVNPGQIISEREGGRLSKIAAGGYKRSEMMEELLNPRYKIYFIDDVGAGTFGSEPVRQAIWYELVDHIYTHQLTIIITTMKAPTRADLGKWIGEQAFDRLMSLVGGRDGIHESGMINKRADVLAQRESDYRS